MCGRYLPLTGLWAAQPPEPFRTMKLLLLSIYYFLYLVNARLVSKKAIQEENAASESVRVITTSKEEIRDSNSEYCKFDTKSIRNPRHSDERAAKLNVTKPKLMVKPKVALVKKPIPKFTYTASEEDYYLGKIPTKDSDAVEHEDEDFSVDDYDFDVNHDEFSGRGKPLEPRVKIKVSKRRKATPAKMEQPRAAPPSQSKVKIPHSESRPSIKVARKAATDKMEEEEYHEEFSAITKSSEKRRKTIMVRDTSSISEESEDSKEEEIKRQMRTTRSSSPFSFGTYVDKLGDKTSEFTSKMLSYLPLFPRRYFSPVVNADVVSENAIQIHD